MTIKTLVATGLLAAGIASLAGTAGAAAPEALNRSSYAEFVAVVFNQGDVAAADRFLEARLVDHAPWPGFPADVAGFKAGLGEMRKSFPDLHVVVERTVAEGDMLAAHLRLSGTQLGPFMGKPASGKTFDVEAIDIVRMSNGRIAEHWGLIDTTAMAERLGM